MDNNKPQKKVVKRGKGKTVLGALLAVLLLGGGGVGVGVGTGVLDKDAVVDTAQKPIEKIESIISKDNDALTVEGEIVIEDEVIYLDGDEVTVEELKEALLAVDKDDIVCNLDGGKAVKSVYDDVKAVLDELGMKYIENN